jgi:nicotinamide-nucleotide amidase
VAVATTGVGGPVHMRTSLRGQVFVAVASPGLTTVHEYHFDGDPGAIVKQSTQRALCDLAAAVAKLGDDTAEA